MTFSWGNANLSIFMHSLICIDGVQAVAETTGVYETIENWYSPKNRTGWKSNYDIYKGVTAANTDLNNHDCKKTNTIKCLITFQHQSLLRNQTRGTRDRYQRPKARADTSLHCLLATGQVNYG